MIPIEDGYPADMTDAEEKEAEEAQDVIDVRVFIAKALGLAKDDFIRQA